MNMNCLIDDENAQCRGFFDGLLTPKFNIIGPPNTSPMWVAPISQCYECRVKPGLAVRVMEVLSIHSPLSSKICIVIRYEKHMTKRDPRERKSESPTILKPELPHLSCQPHRHFKARPCLSALHRGESTYLRPVPPPRSFHFHHKDKLSIGA
jgi:hypothetical protein